MSKKPIELGLSVERHVHHDESEHHHGPADYGDEPEGRNVIPFGTDSLTTSEQVLAVIFVGGISIIFLIIIGFIILNLF